jgi:hypothetical protein
MSGAPKIGNRTPFSRYQDYISRLQTLLRDRDPSARWHEQVEAALNGQANVELERASSLKVRRKFGAFFTGTDLGTRLLSGVGPIDKGDVFFDASCGMGDLLLAVARKLPLEKTLPETLQQWGRQLTGTDLHREFVDGTKARIVLLARQRHGSYEPLGQQCVSFFPDIFVGDGLKQESRFKRATHLVLNPPFGLVSD